MISYDRAETMSKEELLRINGAIDVADEEMVLLMNRAFYGEQKKK